MVFSTIIFLCITVAVSAFDKDRLSPFISTSVTDVYTSTVLTAPSMTASVVTISFNGRYYINTAYFPVTSAPVSSTAFTKTSTTNTYTVSNVQSSMRSNNRQRYVTDDWEMYQRISQNDIVVEAVHELQTTVGSLAYVRAVFALFTLLILSAWFRNSCCRHISCKLPNIFFKRTSARHGNSYENHVFQNDEA